MTNKLFLYMEQDGEGCDYTIGCGSKLVPLKTGSIEEINSVLSEYGTGDAIKLKKCCVLSLVEKVDIDAYQEHIERTVKRESVEAEMKMLQDKLTSLKREAGIV